MGVGGGGGGGGGDGKISHLYMDYGHQTDGLIIISRLDPAIKQLVTLNNEKCSVFTINPIQQELTT